MITVNTTMRRVRVGIAAASLGQFAICLQDEADEKPNITAYINRTQAIELLSMLVGALGDEDMHWGHHVGV